MGIQIKQKTRTMECNKKADIVFCIDNSYSMSDCISGVRETVSDFASSLEAGVEGQSPVDWRIGLVSYSHRSFLFMNLEKDTSKFKAKLEKDVEGGDEFTPGALDFAISKSSWREKAQRIIVLFTDETLKTGVGGRDGFDDLLAKIIRSGIQIVYYGPDCPSYRRFKRCPRAEVNIVSDFSGVRFDELMRRLAVTVSSGDAFARLDSVDRKLVYDLSSIKIID